LHVDQDLDETFTVDLGQLPHDVVGQRGGGRLRLHDQHVVVEFVVDDAPAPLRGRIPALLRLGGHVVDHTSGAAGHDSRAGNVAHPARAGTGHQHRENGGGP
jgi:hypothetical protein